MWWSNDLDSTGARKHILSHDDKWRPKNGKYTLCLNNCNAIVWLSPDRVCLTILTYLFACFHYIYVPSLSWVNSIIYSIEEQIIEQNIPNSWQVLTNIFRLLRQISFFHTRKRIFANYYFYEIVCLVCSPNELYFQCTEKQNYHKQRDENKIECIEKYIMNIFNITC